MYKIYKFCFATFDNRARRLIHYEIKVINKQSSQRSSSYIGGYENILYQMIMYFSIEYDRPTLKSSGT
jgi:hypothetical protein